MKNKNFLAQLHPLRMDEQLLRNEKEANKEIRTKIENPSKQVFCNTLYMYLSESNCTLLCLRVASSWHILW